MGSVCINTHLFRTPYLFFDKYVLPVGPKGQYTVTGRGYVPASLSLDGFKTNEKKALIKQ